MKLLQRLNYIKLPKLKLIYITALICFLNITAAAACSSNYDCDLGSKCYKPGNNMFGYCIGGMNPGNSYDDQPSENIFQPSQGNTCSSDFDCDIGHSCLKSSSSFQGICS